jgi:hypothetical protein
MRFKKVVKGNVMVVTDVQLFYTAHGSGGDSYEFVKPNTPEGRFRILEAVSQTADNAECGMHLVAEFRRWLNRVMGLGEAEIPYVNPWALFNQDLRGRSKL